MLRSVVKPLCEGLSGVKKELGLNPPCTLLLGYSKDEGNDENLDKGLCSRPSWIISSEDGEKLCWQQGTPSAPANAGAVLPRLRRRHMPLLHLGFHHLRHGLHRQPIGVVLAF
jgi:hypothetical protein